MSSERTHRPETGRHDAVSSVVGEMLMLTAVVVILSVVAVYATSLVPPAREPTVTVKMSTNGTHAFLYHLGGDAIPKSDIRVLVNGIQSDWSLFNPEGVPMGLQDDLFDLGSWILMPAGKSDEIRIATYRATLFTGKVPS